MREVKYTTTSTPMLELDDAAAHGTYTIRALVWGEIRTYLPTNEAQHTVTVVVHFTNVAYWCRAEGSLW